MSQARRLCSLETPHGVWRLSLDPKSMLVRAVVVDRGKPAHLLWRSRANLRKGRGRALTARLKWRGADVLVRVEREQVRISVTLSLPLAAPPPAERPREHPALLERIATNPILAPCPDRRWESLAVFNAAAIALENRVHLVYRAIGDDGVSVFGCASTRDGTYVDERIAAPVYTHDTAVAGAARGAQRSAYQSGSSHVGCEDPRITRVGERLFMTYTAFDGCNPPGVAMTSIALRDFVARRWHWTMPQRISAPGQAQKNWVLFPEKIGGRFALLHGISPDVQIEFLDDLEFRDGAFVRSGYSCSGRADSWDNRIRGVGPPPLRTDTGWLVLYHAMDERDPGRYKVGAMLLDAADPTRILGRLPHPLLEPDARCENEGYKRGVVYACGAVQLGQRLVVYYGGADSVLCAATLDLRRLLTQLASARPRATLRPH